MKSLKDILKKVDVLEIVGSENVNVSSICFDSRKVVKGSLFIAINGTQVDGHNFIENALASGAVAIISEKFPSELTNETVFVKVEDSSYTLGLVASNFYNNPSEKLKLVAVTGTNGKTSVASCLHDTYLKMGESAGLLSTIVNKIGNKEVPSTHTTPDAIALNKLLSKMVKEGCEYCFMEASSHAIHQNRTSGLFLTGALFTNISHDHLDYHTTFDEYILAKKALFDGLSDTAFALINKDDKHGGTMLHHCKAQHKSYAIKSMADFKCKIIENRFEGLLLNIDGQEIWTKLVGEFNAYNLLAVYSTAILLGQDSISVLKALSTVVATTGRFQIIRSAEGVIGIIDYAHTPDALKNVLQTIQAVKSKSQQLITLVGCGGDRDKPKRPLMAQIACELSDRVILTSDNPRTEDPLQILNDMTAGIKHYNLKKYLCIESRSEAIKTACAFAETGNVILVAGKGHEKYQEKNGVKHPFDDVQELKKSFKMMSK